MHCRLTSFRRHRSPSFVRPAAFTAFTLIELLVVTAVIAILAAMLFPALGRAKESARTTVCQSNLKQLCLAAQLYADDHRGNLPAFLRWLHGSPGGQDLRTGRLFPYLKSTGVYQCPTDRAELGARRTPTGGRFTAGAKQKLRDYSYAMNCAICHSTSISQFKDPSATVLFLEAVLSPTDFSGQVSPSFGGGPSSLAFRHNKRGHIVMGDLSVRRLDRKAFDQASKVSRFWFPNDTMDSDRSGPL